MTTIRSARPDDLPAVQRFLGENGLVLEGLADLGEGLLVAEVDGQVTGAVGIEHHGVHGLLRSLVVAAEPAEIADSHEFSTACPASAAFMRRDVA